MDVRNRLNAREAVDQLYLDHALRTHRRAHAIQCSGTQGSWTETLYSNKADFTALASSATEASLLSGTNEQPVLPSLFYNQQERRVIRLTASGVFSTTGTPTMIFQVRLGSTAAVITGTSIGVTAAITTINNSSNQYWELVLRMVCTTPGIGTGNTTLSGAGTVTSGGGFASPFIYAVEPTTPPTATWTATTDLSLNQFLQLSLTWSASSASNTCTCKQLVLEGLN